MQRKAVLSRSSAASGSAGTATAETDRESWYRRGRAVVDVEMVLAVLVTVFPLYTVFTGRAGLLA